MTAAPPATAPPWTVRALLAWTTDFFKGKGIETPVLEARILLAHVLKWPRIELVARSDEEPDPTARAALRELVRRRAEGWPVAYLTAEREFCRPRFAASPASRP